MVQSSIRKLLAIVRAKMTPEQVAERERAMEARFTEMDRELIERHRCTICGADTLNYSHTFDCPRRGSGF